jgi:hypothetical protein
MAKAKKAKLVLVRDPGPKEVLAIFPLPSVRPIGSNQRTRMRQQ